MIVGNRFVRVIFLAFFIILISINLYYFFVIDVAVDQYTYYGDFIEFNGHNPQYFHGFNWFFNKLGSFPGLSRLMDFMSETQKWVPDFKNGNPFADILQCLKFMAYPFICMGLLIVTIFENIWWCLSFLIEPIVH